MGSIHRQLEALQQQLAAIQERLPAARPAPRQGVFVVGCPRSGTSALSWAVGAHRAFFAGPESNFLYSLASEGVAKAYKKGTVHRNAWLLTNDVGFDEFAAAIGAGVHLLFSSRAQGLRWVDSSTENTLVLDALARMFPGAKFLHVVRDGRAVVASMLDSGFGMDWSGDFETACRTWVQFVTAGCEFQRDNPGRMLELRNETMAGEAERIVAFLDESGGERISRFLEGRRINSSYGPDGKAHAPKEPWRRWTVKQARLFDKIAGPTMRSLGYPGARE